MGEKNDAILRYLEDNARFADLMNGAVFGGIQAVDPGQLEDASEHYTEKEGIEEGIRAMILDNLENGSSREQIREKLGKYFGMSEKRASEYLEHFLQEAGCLSAV